MVKWKEPAPTCVQCTYAARWSRSKMTWTKSVETTLSDVVRMICKASFDLWWLLLQIISFVWAWFWMSALFRVKHIVMFDKEKHHKTKRLSLSSPQACRRPPWWPRLTWSRHGCRWRRGPGRPPTAAWRTASGRFSERRDPGPSGKELEVMFAEANV